MRMKIYFPAFLLGTCGILPLSPAYSAGFALAEQGVSGMGNAYAGGAAYAEDASTIFFNPAGMGEFTQERFDIAGHYLRTSFKFTNTGSTGAAVLGRPALTGRDSDGGQPAPVPNIYYLTPLSDFLVFGFGMFTPFGLNTLYDDDWVGRYHAVQTQLTTVNLNPSLAVKLTDKLSVGVGANFQYASVLLSSAIDFGALCFSLLDAPSCRLMNILPQQTDGFVAMTADTADSIGFGWNWGVLFKPAPHTRIGAAYRSQIKHRFKGNAEFTVPGAAAFVTNSGYFTDGEVSSELTVPPIFSLSAYHGTDARFGILADLTWTGWSTFDELRIKYASGQPDSVTTEGWRNSYRASLGFNYRVSELLLLRTGAAYDKSPIPDADHRTPRGPDNDRTWLTLGSRFSVTPGVDIDLGYAHLIIRPGEINNTLESSAPTMQATLHGKYDMNVDILSAQLNWRFE